MLTCIKAAYGFDSFLKSYRPRRADRGLQRHYSVEFEVRPGNGEARVFVRSKPAIGAKTCWSAFTQMYPSLLDGRGNPPHAPDTVPPVLENKEWDDFEMHVVPTLRR